MMTLVKFSRHALEQFAIRTGTRPFEATEELKRQFQGAREVNLRKATELFPITKVVKGDTYWVWYNGVIKENLCAIKRKNGMIVTILSQHIFKVRKKGHRVPAPLKVINGTMTRLNERLVSEQRWEVTKL